MKITNYIHDKKEYTVIIFTGFEVCLNDLLNTMNYLDHKKISDKNRKFFVPFSQRDSLKNIPEILRTKEEALQKTGCHFGSFLGMEIFLLGEETIENNDYFCMVKKDWIETYFNNRLKPEYGSLTYIFFGIIIGIIILLLFNFITSLFN